MTKEVMKRRHEKSSLTELLDTYLSFVEIGIPICKRGRATGNLKIREARRYPRALGVQVIGKVAKAKDQSGL